MIEEESYTIVLTRIIDSNDLSSEKWKIAYMTRNKPGMIEFHKAELDSYQTALRFASQYIQENLT